MLRIEWITLYIALGALVGFMAGLLGAGGGGILVPLLTSMFTYQGMSTDNVVHVAVGTSLTCMIISSAASARAHASRGNVEWPIVRGMAPGIILGAFLITQGAANLESAFISLFFALFMALIAAQMFFVWHPKPSRKPPTLRGLISVGFGIGSVSALAAVGGGFLTVAYLGYKNVSMKSAVGTASAIGFAIAIAGTVGYVISGWSRTLSDPYTLGFIYLPAFVAISLTSSVVAPYGARCSHGLSEKFLKRIFALIALLLSIKMLMSFH
ncbi:MAG: sulfite exporter TauE/SafE family protein [Cyanobacteria bacterium P01_F01_bin.86]